MFFSVAPRVRRLTLGYRAGGTVSGRLCAGCRMGEKLQSLGNGNMLTKLAGVSSIYTAGVMSNMSMPYTNGLCCENCGVGSLMDNFLRTGRFKFRRVTCLLLFKRLPGRGRLRGFGSVVTSHQVLPPGFMHSIVVGTPDHSVVGDVAEDVLRLCSCSSGTSSADVPGMLHRDLGLVDRFPVLVICDCLTCGCEVNRSLCVCTPGGRLSVTRGVLVVLERSHRCARLRTGVLSVTLILRVSRNNNGGSAFAARIIASSKASACSAVTTTVTSLGKPGRNNTGMGMARVFRSVGARLAS